MMGVFLANFCGVCSVTPSSRLLQYVLHVVVNALCGFRIAQLSHCMEAVGAEVYANARWLMGLTPGCNRRW